MYKRALGALVCVYLALFGGMIILLGVTKEPETEAAQLCGRAAQMGITEYSSSGRRVVDYLLLEQTKEETQAQEQTGAVSKQQTDSAYSQADIEVLQRIVEAEAGGEDADGKLLVANVVLNRVRDEAFPDTIPGVVFQRDYGVTQFSPVASGSYYRVQVSDETVGAVERALAGEDLSEGALYFAARKYADSRNMRWFDENLTFLFQHGGHEFFK